METDELILHYLINDEAYIRKVIPFLQPEYFDGAANVLFKIVYDFFDKYNNVPTYASLQIDVDEYRGMDSHTYDALTEFFIKSKELESKVDQQWLVDITETFCKDRALNIAMLEAMAIMDSIDENLSKSSIPQLLQDALGVSFDCSVGHDFIEDSSTRYDQIHADVARLPFNIDILNKITKGGVTRKTLNVLMAPTGGFKSGSLCHFASHYFLSGLNVLYITLEMSEEKIGERIDCNLLDVDFDTLDDMQKSVFEKKIEYIKSRTPGKLIIKEYPTATANVNHFRFLLRELRTMKGFVPDVILIDYLNICASARVKDSGNSYNYAKSIAEELRGLFVEHDVVGWTATQTNRDGWDSGDLKLSNTSESAGVPATSDLYLGVIGGEDLDLIGQLTWKQLKNRYGDINYYRKFNIGCNKSKMKLYDLETKQSATPLPPKPSEQDVINSTSTKTEKFKSFKV